MCLLMIWPIPPQLLHSLTWTQQLCCLVLLQNLVFIPPSILLIQHHVCLIHPSLVRSITIPLVVFKNSYRIIDLFKILLLFLVWTISQKKINLLSPVPVRSSVSYHNHSLWVKSSQVNPESLSNFKTQLRASVSSLRVLAMSSPKILSTWLAHLRKLSNKVESYKL